MFVDWIQLKDGLRCRLHPVLILFLLLWAFLRNVGHILNERSGHILLLNGIERTRPIPVPDVGSLDILLVDGRDGLHQLKVGLDFEIEHSALFIDDIPP